MEQTSGTARLRCRNHPSYRWIKTKYGPGFIGAGVLMFESDGSGKRVNPLVVLSEEMLAREDEKYQELYRERWAVECNCPYSDLEFVEWVE